MSDLNQPGRLKMINDTILRIKDRIDVLDKKVWLSIGFSLAAIVVSSCVTVLVAVLMSRN
jgi:hypothetical protein